MNIRAYEEGFGSVERVAVATAADPERQLRAFEMLIGELAAAVPKGELAATDWADRIQAIAKKTGMVEAHGQDRIQAIMSAAVDAATAIPISRPPTDDDRPKAQIRPPQERVGPRSKLVICRASEIEPQPVSWLWPNRVALGKVTIVAGEPGLGKSQLTCSVAAVVTTGGCWPCDEGRAPSGNVIILSAEDDPADTIRPRLDAAGADASKVSIISAVLQADGKGRRSFNLQTDLMALEEAIAAAGDVKLVIIDPVSSCLGKVDSHKNAELRAVLEPLGEMAARLGIAVLAITHLSKSGTGSANNRFNGSIAFVAAARAAYVIARDRNDEGRRLFLPTKNNVGPEGSGLAFRIGMKKIRDDIFAPMVLWEAAVTITAEEALAPKGGEHIRAPERENAQNFLRDILENGPLPTRQIQNEAKEAGLTWSTIRRAKDALGVIAKKDALDGGWSWQLPTC